MSARKKTGIIPVTGVFRFLKTLTINLILKKNGYSDNLATDLFVKQRI
jgi:hypothetical protein